MRRTRADRLRMTYVDRDRRDHMIVDDRCVIGQIDRVTSDGIRLPLTNLWGDEILSMIAPLCVMRFDVADTVRLPDIIVCLEIMR